MNNTTLIKKIIHRAIAFYVFQVVEQGNTLKGATKTYKERGRWYQGMRKIGIREIIVYLKTLPFLKNMTC